MAIKSSSLSLALVLIAMVGISACQSKSVKSTKPAPGPAQPKPVPGPITPATPAAQLEDEERPAPTKGEPRRVAVILGPGGAKALAHAGVLKTLQQQRVPVEKIVGLEWGALIGALYANKGQVHDLEWKLYKMEQQNLPHPKGFFKRSDGTVRVMDDFLGDAFANEDIGRTKVGFVCPARSLATGITAWQNRGPLKDGVRRCLAYPPVFKVQGSFIAGASQAQEAIELLAKEGFNVVILVNVLGSALPVAQDELMENVQHVILWQEVRRAILQAQSFNVETINVDTSAYPILQFSAKKELMQLGEAQSQKPVAALISKYGF